MKIKYILTKKVDVSAQLTPAQLLLSNWLVQLKSKVRTIDWQLLLPMLSHSNLGNVVISVETAILHKIVKMLAGWAHPIHLHFINLTKYFRFGRHYEVSQAIIR